mgnify:CR=1 FL=1
MSSESKCVLCGRVTPYSKCTESVLRVRQPSGREVGVSGLICSECHELTACAQFFHLSFLDGSQGSLDTGPTARVV